MRVWYLLLAILICPVLMFGQVTPSQRAQVHSKEVRGGIPGQIPNLLATTSGDVHLDNTRGTYSGVTIAEPDGPREYRL